MEQVSLVVVRWCEMFPYIVANDEWHTKKKQLRRKTFVHGIYSVSRQFGIRIEMPLMPYSFWYLSSASFSIQVPVAFFSLAANLVSILFNLLAKTSFSKSINGQLAKWKCSGWHQNRRTILQTCNTTNRTMLVCLCWFFFSFCFLSFNSWVDLLRLI